MKITNLRAGFATNSSSSHSIVLIPGSVARTNNVEPFEYGWNNFTLADPSSKSDYFFTQLLQAMEGTGLDKSEAVLMLNTLLGTSYTDEQVDGCYVDHQSAWYNIDVLLKNHPQLVRQIYQHAVSSPQVVILGGNDNSDGHPLSDLGQDMPSLSVLETAGEDQLLRQDGLYWTMFNRSSGTKMRFALDDHAPPYNKSTWPELVDLKVTDRCRAGCEWCYQSSTKQGMHADLNNIKQILNTLGHQGVFEVAIGGGEPTHYPHLAEVLTYAAEQNIVPNFTTFFVDWLQNEPLVEAVRAHVGAIGVSVHGVKDFNKLKKIREGLNSRAHGQRGRRVHVTAQHVVGSVDLDETARILERSWEEGWDLLLLGYKQVGFGADQQPHSMEGIDTLLRLRQASKPHWGTRFSMLGVDTAFVEQFGAVLQELNISPVLITAKEGAFSMYIDSVTLMQGPSSYMPDQMVTLDMNNIDHSIKSRYASW